MSETFWLLMMRETRPVGALDLVTSTPLRLSAAKASSTVGLPKKASISPAATEVTVLVLAMTLMTSLPNLGAPMW